MNYLEGKEQKEAERFFGEAARVAEQALCLRDKCGSVIVGRGGDIIGSGYNAPPLDTIALRTCERTYDLSVKPKFDKTCCMHAEWRAILDALRKNPKKLAGSRLYFVRLGADGKPKRSGKPYCTVCSRLALDTGIAEFALWHQEGVCAYPTQVYNMLSYNYYEMP